MTVTASDQVKANLESTLQTMLATAKDLFQTTASSLKPLEALDSEWLPEYKRLDAASSKLPIRPCNRYYQRQLEPASQPFIVYDGLNTDHYGEISSDFVDELTAKYQAHCVEACNSVFENVVTFFREASSRVLTLRYFSNSDALLAKFESALRPPWAVHPQAFSGKVQYRLPVWIGQPVFALSPHEEIHKIRGANLDTLRLLKHKLGEIVATLETAILELPFAEKLETPKSVPQTLIDNSTHIGEHAMVTDSAVGKQSSWSRK